MPEFGLTTLASRLRVFNGKLRRVGQDLAREDRLDVRNEITRAIEDSRINDPVDLADTLDTINTDYNRLKYRVRDLERENARLRSNPGNTDALEQRILDLENVNHRLEDTNRQLEETNRGLRDQLRNPVTLPPNNDVHFLRDMVRRLQTENGRLEETIRDLRNQLHHSFPRPPSNNHFLREEVRRLQIENGQLLARNTDLQAQKETVERMRDELQNKVDNFDANWPRQTGCGDCKASRDHVCARKMRFNKNKK